MPLCLTPLLLFLLFYYCIIHLAIKDGVQITSQHVMFCVCVFDWMCDVCGFWVCVCCGLTPTIVFFVWPQTTRWARRWCQAATGSVCRAFSDRRRLCRRGARPPPTAASGRRVSIPFPARRDRRKYTPPTTTSTTTKLQPPRCTILNLQDGFNHIVQSFEI